MIEHDHIEADRVAGTGARMRNADHAATLERITALARLLDARFGIPGTPLRFGLDSLVGLIPGIGDSAMAALSGYIIFEAHRLGASKVTLVRMIWNVIIDLVFGAVPVVGDMFDFYWKSNLKNIDLLKREIEKKQRG